MRVVRHGRALIGAAAAFVISCATAPASGLIVMDADSPSTSINNTADPASSAHPDFPYWNNMLGLHTYLGNGYLITANHVLSPSSTLPSTIVINSVTYNRTAAHRLTTPNPPGSPVNSDLWIWKIGGNPLPNLPTIVPITSGLVGGEETLMIGDGFSRTASPTFWDVTVNGGANDDVWNVVGDEGLADTKGFVTDSAQKEWGTNRVANPSIAFGPGTLTRGYTVNFSTVNGTDFEAQATNDDSSGPVFVKRNGQWELTGLMHGVTVLFENQPTSPSFAGIYSYLNSANSSGTAISDLSQYTQQLIDFGVIPEPSGAIGLAMLSATGLLARRARGAGPRGH